MKKSILFILALSIIIPAVFSLQAQAQETAQQPLNSFPAQINPQIIDSVNQVNLKVLGDAPGMALDNLYQSTAQALSNAAHNATNAQQQSYVTTQASTTSGVSTLYSIDTATEGAAIPKILGN